MDTVVAESFVVRYLSRYTRHEDEQHCAGDSGAGSGGRRRPELAALRHNDNALLSHDRSRQPSRAGLPFYRDTVTRHIVRPDLPEAVKLKSEAFVQGHELRA